MKLSSAAHELVHQNGAHEGAAIAIKGAVRTLGLQGDYRKFGRDHGVSREHCTIRTPDGHASLWVEDRHSRKGTYVSIGGAGKSPETFPVFPDVCLRISKSNFYFAAPPERHDASSEEDSGESEEEDESLDDASLHADLDHRLLVKFRGPGTKRQRRIILTGRHTISAASTCDIVVADDDEMAPLHCIVDVDTDRGVFYV